MRYPGIIESAASSGDIRDMFCETCEQLGLHWTASGRYTIYVSRKADVARLDEFIGPRL